MVDRDENDGPDQEAEAAGESAPELTLGSSAAEGGERTSHYTPAIRGGVDRFGAAMGTGRRKTSVARVRITQGNGQISINGRPLEGYCRIERDRHLVMAPLKAADKAGKVNVWVRVDGGGTTGQAGAMVLGIARALEAFDAGLHHRLSEHGFLTRDERMVERKKYGRKKARRSFQFSKR